MAIDISQSDFVGVGQVAKHCDTEKLKISIEESIIFDLTPLLGNLYGEVDEKWEETEGVIKDIVEAKTYDNCNGYKTSHLGLKKVLVYFAYSRYIIINGFNDTSIGQVNKQNPFSIPKSLPELKQYSNKYRDMAFNSFMLVEAYILKNKKQYPGYDFSKLQDCGCNGTCGKKTKAKGFGLRSRTIRK